MQYTTKEQGRRLVELGLDTRTADMVIVHEEPYETSDTKFDGCHAVLCVPYAKHDGKHGLYKNIPSYPAWSLDALLKVIPCPYQMTRGRDGAVQFMLINVLRHDTFDSELEAVYTMVVWLLENDLLDPIKLKNVNLN